MEQLTLGVQHFSEILKGNYTWVNEYMEGLTQYTNEEGNNNGESDESGLEENCSDDDEPVNLILDEDKCL